MFLLWDNGVAFLAMATALVVSGGGAFLTVCSAKESESTWLGTGVRLGMVALLVMFGFILINRAIGSPTGTF